MSDKLSWSHMCELITIDDELERQFYENECIKEKWDVRTLRCEKDAALFLRLASSKNKEGILALAKEGITYQTPEDVIKNTYTLDFLNIPQMTMYSESELEQKIFWSLCSYMVRSCKGIEIMVNLINISYCVMKLLPYVDNEFADYKDKSVQEFRFVISEGIRKQIFFTGFVQNIETQIKSKSVISAIKQAFRKHGCHL